jgi:hypothetical protein
MRVAWPELIVLVVLAAIVVFVVEGLFLSEAMGLGMPAGVGVVCLVALLVLDLWGLLRLFDWLFAGPARRKKGSRIVPF